MILWLKVALGQGAGRFSLSSTGKQRGQEAKHIGSIGSIGGGGGGVDFFFLSEIIIASQFSVHRETQMAEIEIRTFLSLTRVHDSLILLLP